ncbi:MAG: TraX family protein [Ruminococcus sp.]
MKIKKTLNSDMLKIIAITAMTVDHIAWLVFPGYPKDIVPIIMHIIGRITCPIMCYFIAEGYHYTKDINKYTRRLFVFAFISHFAYVFASNDFAGIKSFIPFYYGSFLNQTSVMWSLAWGLVMLRVVNSEKIKQNPIKILLVILICLISFPSDWSCIASLCILAFGTNRGNPKAQFLWMIFYVAIYAAVYFFALDKVYGILQLGVVFAIPIILLYNGKRSSREQKSGKFMKWFFYIYYPLHLFVIGLIQFCVSF